jgi:hypothetical protein
VTSTGSIAVLSPLPVATQESQKSGIQKHSWLTISIDFFIPGLVADWKYSGIKNSRKFQKAKLEFVACQILH